MEVRTYGQRAAPQVLVLLPGAQMFPIDIERAGLPALLQRSELALDLQVPDLHLDPSGRTDACQRLATEVLAPLARRYTGIWLAGISLGGLLALLSAQQHPGNLRGLCLLAPYPGSRLTTNAIARTGGLQGWQITDAQRRDPEVLLWDGLRQGLPGLPAFIGWGRQDRFTAGMRALAQCLPGAHRHEVEGDHDWLAWRPLWQRALGWIAATGEAP